MKVLIAVIALGVLALGFAMFRFTYKMTKNMFQISFKLVSWSYKGAVKLIKLGYKGADKLIKWMVKEIPGLKRDKWADLKHKLEQVKKIS